MYCICCKKNNVIPLDITSKWVVDKPNEEDLLWKNERDEHSKEIRYKTIQNEMINNGIIDIKKMNIQLVNDIGRPMDLNGMDFSFCLEVTQE